MLNVLSQRARLAHRFPAVSPLLGSMAVLGSAALGSLVLTAAAGHAESPGLWTIEVDPGRSAIRFTLGATLHDVEGTLQLTSGEIQFDPTTGEARGEVVLDATSADTGNEKRDRDMHAKVLESDRYPRIVYRPAAVRGDLPSNGTGSIAIEGEIELHGDTHPLVLEIEAEIDGEVARGSGSLTIPYVAWGLKDPSKFVLRVEKTVAVAVEIEGHLSMTPTGPEAGPEDSKGEGTALR